MREPPQAQQSPGSLEEFVESLLKINLSISHVNITTMTTRKPDTMQATKEIAVNTRFTSCTRIVVIPAPDGHGENTIREAHPLYSFNIGFRLRRSCSLQ